MPIALSEVISVKPIYKRWYPGYRYDKCAKTSYEYIVSVEESDRVLAAFKLSIQLVDPSGTCLLVRHSFQSAWFSRLSGVPRIVSVNAE